MEASIDPLLLHVSRARGKLYSQPTTLSPIPLLTACLWTSLTCHRERDIVGRVEIPVSQCNPEACVPRIWHIVRISDVLTIESLRPRPWELLHRS